MNRGFLLQDAARLVTLSTGMPFDNVEPLDKYTFLFGKYLENLAGLVLILAGYHHHGVTFFYVQTLSWHYLISQSVLKYFRGKGYDFHKFLRPEFPGNWPKNAGPNRLFLVIDDNAGIPVKTDI